MAHFEQNSVPEPLPGAGEDPVDETVPQLAQACLDPLAYLAYEQTMLLGHIGQGQQSHPRLLLEQTTKRLAAVALVADGKPLLLSSSEQAGDVSVLVADAGRGQQYVQDRPILVYSG